ncbi:MAG: glucosamine-6-phosphate deaminase [Clostridia bacterium]|nr:glucosamine-6-phosphate deaminase [Clostridia bacterium]
MKIVVKESNQEMGLFAAVEAAKKLNAAIAKNGEARLILATGASQFEVVKALAAQDVDWTKVTMFHLDEYVNLPESHIASFRKYLKERFADHVNLKAAHYVNGEGDVEKNIQELTAILREAPVDVAMIGIGENAHIAFNDPPANFDTKEAYIVVDLDEKCRMQQVGEGWFAGFDDVPKQAISMTVYQIMQAHTIICSVPGPKKIKAVHDTLVTEGVTNMVPATVLKNHPDCYLVLDEASASGTPAEYLK